MVKNRSETEGKKSFTERNRLERQFFSSGRYKDLPTTMKGVESLHGRLSLVLNNHLKTELPKLRKELDEKVLQINKGLEQLGVKRNTVSEQRVFLTDISPRINDTIKAASRGQYESAFFGQSTWRLRLTLVTAFAASAPLFSTST